MVTSTDRRGAEVFAVDLDAELSRLGHRVRTVALAPGRGGSPLEVPVLGPSTLGPRTLLGLRRAGRDADVVVAHGSRTLPACAAALVGGARFVYRNIGDPAHWSGSGLRRARTTAALSRAAHVVALTDAAAATLREGYRVRASRISVIPTGVSAARHQPASAEQRASAREELGVPAAAPVVAVVGALSPEKNVGLAIDAVTRLPGAHLVIAGDGPERASLAVAARRAGDRVHLVGAVADPRVVYAAADVVVLCSHTEGLPGVLVEAAFHGLPAVTTDVGYVRTIVIDSETGVVVPPGDAALLATGIARALEAAPTMGPGARVHAREHFELATIATRWSTLLEQLPA